ncbi:hypothetical protein GCM10027047_27360 [Rhodococcus aerolatus]
MSTRTDVAGVRLLRGVSGVVAGALVVMAVVVVAAEVVSTQRAVEGPGAATVALHVVAALLAVPAQVHADHRRGAAAVPGALVVVLVAVALLWAAWWP